MKFDVIDIKERIATGNWKPEERDFILDCINQATKPPRQVEVELQDPGNYLGRVDHIWAFLSLDDGGEGVCAAPLPPYGHTTVPLIVADKARLDSLIPMAKKIAKWFGKPVRLAKFTKREDVEIYQP